MPSAVSKVDSFLVESLMSPFATLGRAPGRGDEPRESSEFESIGRSTMVVVALDAG